MSKLTERERWLMREAWEGRRIFGLDFDHWLSLLEGNGSTGRTVEAKLAEDAPQTPIDRLEMLNLVDKS